MCGPIRSQYVQGFVKIVTVVPARSAGPQMHELIPALKIAGARGSLYSPARFVSHHTHNTRTRQQTIWLTWTFVSKQTVFVDDVITYGLRHQTSGH